MIVGIISFFLVIEGCTIVNEKLGHLFESLGNLTYASYLIHVPLQILILIAIHASGLDQANTVTNNLFFGFIS